jgi:hypothetical protein
VVIKSQANGNSPAAGPDVYHRTGRGHSFKRVFNQQFSLGPGNQNRRVNHKIEAHKFLAASYVSCRLTTPPPAGKFVKKGFFLL